MHTKCLSNSASLINGVRSTAKCFAHMHTNEENGMGNELSGWFQAPSGNTTHMSLVGLTLHW